jgi:hypothetical protein
MRIPTAGDAHEPITIDYDNDVLSICVQGSRAAFCTLLLCCKHALCWSQSAARTAPELQPTSQISAELSRYEVSASCIVPRACMQPRSIAGTATCPGCGDCKLGKPPVRTRKCQYVVVSAKYEESARDPVCIYLVIITVSEPIAVSFDCDLAQMTTCDPPPRSHTRYCMQMQRCICMPIRV